MSEVLDASAILAVVQSGTGAEVVSEAIPDGVISVVNISEVVAKLTDRGYRDDAIRKELRELNLAVKDFDEDQAYPRPWFIPGRPRLYCPGSSVRIGCTHRGPELGRIGLWCRREAGPVTGGRGNLNL